MAAVTMPDGTVVNMPDQLDPAMGARLRAFNNDQASKKLSTAIAGIKPPTQGDPTSNPLGMESHEGASGFLNGLAESVVKGAANIPYSTLHGASDLIDQIRGKPPQPDGPILSALHVQPSANAQSATGAVQESQRENAPTVQDAVSDFTKEHAPNLHRAVGDVIESAPGALGAAGIARNVVGTASNAARSALATNTTDAGLSLQRQGPIRTALSGGEGLDQATLQNADKVNAIAGGEAGVQNFNPRTGTEAQAMLEEGRKAPSDVYNRVANGVNTVPLSEQTVARIGNAGGNAMQVGSPDVQSQIAQLKSNLLNGPTDGQTMVNNGRSLRYDGFRNSGSQDPNLRTLGKTQLDMADAVEDHLAQNLPKNADVTMQQFIDARKALAKNATVAGAVDGSSIDPQAIARMNANSPGRMSEGLQHIADWAADNPAVARTAQSVTAEPSTLGAAANSHNSVTAIAKLMGGKMARGIFAGDPEATMEQARSRFPARDDAQFAPIHPGVRASAYPALPPAQATVGPAPTRMEGVGDTSAPVGLADELGLSPGTRAAAKQHPAVARPGVEETPPRNMPVVDLHPHTGDYSDVLATSRAQMQPPPTRPNGIPLSDVLSHGVEQPQGPGLSLADELMPPRSSDSIDFKPNAEHMAGGLSLADELTGSVPRGTNADLPKVASQGVPEDTMTRTPSKPKFKAGDVISAPKGGFQKPKKVTDG